VLLECLLLAIASLAFGLAPDKPRTYLAILLTAAAMGFRNAVVRKLGIPDLTTTVLTLTLTGIASDSSLGGGTNPRWKTRLLGIVMMAAGAGIGAALERVLPLAPLLLSSVLAVITGAFVLRSQS